VITVAYEFQVTQDSVDPHALAEWWAETLGWEVETSDEAFIRRMISEGHASQADTRTYKGVLVWKDGAAIRHEGGPRVHFQLVPEKKAAKNRMHLDLRIGDDDVDAVVGKLVARGATFLQNGRQGPHTWATLADPEGNEFCVSR
jgi:predicted enzyme related to lactoylglutathione lyase